MNIIPDNILVHRFADGKTGIDERAIWYLRRWLNEEEACRLCVSLSEHRTPLFDGVVQRALYAHQP